MTPLDNVNEDDEQFTLLLVRYSEALTGGCDADPAADPALSAEMRQRLQRHLDCLRRLLRFRPRLPRPDAVTLGMEKTIVTHRERIGEEIGRFRILGTLGHGGGGIVLLAYDPDLSREVALKVPHLPILFTPEMRRSFLREARLAARLEHPNLVPIHEVGEANGLCFIVLAYCRGGSLAQWLTARKTPVPIRQIVELMAVLADAVQYIHENGIYHRDLKPGNVLLDPAGARRTFDLGFTPRLTDFGVAKQMGWDSGLAVNGGIVGTPSYMAPEQIEGRSGMIDARTDVYGLGAILYELLTGRPPFKGKTDSETLVQVLQFIPPVRPRQLRSETPRDVEAICLKCLEKLPQRRYASAAELANDLRRFLSEEPIQARTPGRSERLRKWIRRHPAKAIFSALSLLLLLSLGIGWLRLEALERAHDADRAAAAKQQEERRQAIRQRERHLRRLHYTNDIAQAWDDWKNRRLEYITDLLDKHRPSADWEADEDIRGFEWYFLSRLVRTRPRAMRYLSAMYCLAFSPDGATCACGHEDGSIVLWDVASGRQRKILKNHKHAVRALTYSPDGKYLASGSGVQEGDRLRGELLLWDTQTGNTLSVDLPPLGTVNSLAFSPDGEILATALDFGSSCSEIMLWEMPSEKLRTKMTFPTRDATLMAFSSDGTTVAVNHSDGKISLGDSRTGQVLEARPGLPGNVWSMTCGHKGAVVVLGGQNGIVRLCSLRRGDSSVKEYPHAGIIRSVALSPDDRRIASICHGMLKIWDRDSQRELFSCTSHEKGNVVAFSPGGRNLAVGDDYGRLWMYDIPRTAGGKWAIHEGSSSAEVLSWLGHCDGKEPREAWAIAFSPDGKLLASAGDDHLIRLWEPATGRALAILRGHQSLVTSLAFSPNGKLLASGSFDKEAQLKLWDAASGVEIGTLNGHNERVDSVVFSRDGTILASAGREGVVRLWDVSTRKQLPILSDRWHDLPGHWVESLAFSSDGRTLALASHGQAPFLWDIKEQKLSRTLPPHPLGHVSVAFSPDGKTLVTGCYEGTVRFFDAATGELRFSARNHSDVVNCLAFTPDGKTLATAGFDKKVKLWQVSTGRELLTLPEQSDRVRWLAFSPDGTTLATAGHDGFLKIYRADKTEKRP